MSEPILLDNRRTPCAVGLIRAAQRMGELPPGTVLQIWSKDRFAPIEIPLWAEYDGHVVTRSDKGGTWPFRYFVFDITKSRR